jgi:phenylpropionate dioxygenase-like ring-hydroxylating dioxygenase large terminal subunit
MQLKKGLIYVNLDSSSVPFSHPNLDALLANYDSETFRIAHTAEEIWNTNWKCLVENFMEGYHLSVVHPETLHDYTPTGLARKLIGGDGFTCYAANYPKTIPSRGMGAPTLTNDERLRSTLFTIYPTLVASQAGILLVSLNIFPLNAAQIQVKWMLSIYGDDQQQDTILARIMHRDKVNQED